MVDEDPWTPPAAVRRGRIPRRGSVGIAPVTPVPDAAAQVARFLADRDDAIRNHLDRSDPDLREAGTAYLDGRRAAVGAGAVAFLAGWGRRQDPDLAAPFADSWLLEHGPVFAAEASVTVLAVTGRDKLQWTEPGVMGPGRRDRARRIAGRVRAYLAAASDEVYAEVTAALGAWRKDHLAQRVATSFLVPTRADRVTDDCHAVAATVDAELATTLLYTVSTPGQYPIIADNLMVDFQAFTPQTLATVVDAMGPAAADVLAHWIDHRDMRADMRRRAVSMLAALPGDRPLRLLRDRADGRHHKLVRPAILEVTRRSARPLVTEAALTSVDLPPVLADPPWLRKRAATRPVVVEGLSCDEPPSVGWLPGERDRWLTSMATTRYAWPSSWWDEQAERFRAGDLSGYGQAEFLRDAPKELARPLIATWRPPRRWAERWTPAIAARFELDALPALLDVARRTPATAAGALLPFASPEIAVLMADWYSRLRSVRAVAEAWLVRHAALAGRTLVPLALSPPGPARRRAERTLRGLAATGRRDRVSAAAATYGPGVAEAVDALLAVDPVDLLPPRMPAAPGWVDPAAFPRVRLTAGAALPATAAAHVVTMLAISRLDDAYAGLDQVRQACDQGDLAEFAWSLFRSWRASGSPSKDSWALDALGLLGDDETVRRLTPVIRAWPGEGGMSRAAAGLDALVAIGTEVALLHLHGIAQTAKSRTLRDHATTRVGQVAADRGLSPEQLADRLVPDLGLDPHGSLVLDYGSRRFTVTFDEQLRPVVLDEAGTRRADLPKPGATDDPALAPGAHQRFTALKKDVRTVAADQLRRLESAMVGRRRWPVAEFRQLFLAHPLLVHLVRRLVWLVHDDAGTGSFRVAEDRTFADAADDARDLPEEATVSVAHPLHLGPDLAAWTNVFADYDILQPFPQLRRDVYEPLAGERGGTLVRFTGRTVRSVRLLGLERRGWDREAAGDGGRQNRLSRTLPDGTTAVLVVAPGILAGAVEAEPVQTVTSVDLRPAGDLDPVVLSETIRDLEAVTG
ncbi:DUF4132 domain-containing protein [Virgisporangium ochraceum]|uniref:DUF4132 domain-containing protein n=1 Tax=Virgisporangium ochraceum TaxID=65505 RepID=A0A8J3ZXT6_9ACTN|nr:DUF4132 domain-containing protein [Virgisporangium ochraceum]GIJ70470.1 hypothetical protein Voc01_053870 [Virgisporangium ochraceum]